MDENSPLKGVDFMAEVAKQWEEAFRSFETPQTRKAILRISLIFGNSGGIYPVLRTLAKTGLGGTMGPGDQVVSWIHIEDVDRIIRWMIDNENAHGPYNLAAPGSVSNKELMALLRKKTGMPLGIPSPAWGLKLGGFIARKEPSLLLESHNTAPGKLLKEGFQFKYRTMQECLNSLR
jgi:uncharacterized protein (TIGR01777 family)